MEAKLANWLMIEVVSMGNGRSTTNISCRSCIGVLACQHQQDETGVRGRSQIPSSGMYLFKNAEQMSVLITSFGSKHRASTANDASQGAHLASVQRK